MVLQRNNASIWGRVIPVNNRTVFTAVGTKVTLTVLRNDSGCLFQASTDAVSSDGSFVITDINVSATANTTIVLNASSLAPADRASVVGRQKRPSSSSSSSSKSLGVTTTLLHNVAFGDVLLCSGQSNMEYPMANAFYGDQERAHHSDYPKLRLLTVKTQQASDPQADVESLAPYVWAPSSSATVSPRVNGSFGVPFPSAVCFFAARELIIANPSIPLGVITIAVGGTAIEQWMAPTAILDGTPAHLGGNGTCGGTVDDVPAALHRRFFNDDDGGGGGTLPVAPGNATCNPQARGASSLYYGMIAPFLRMRVAAFLWYQGEENDHKEDACYGPEWYRCLFPAMIAHWRSAFGLFEVPFLYVLLAGGHTALMREAQFLGAEALPLTAFASAMDLGAYGTEFLVPGHPPRKQEVGRRLALLVDTLVYHNDTASSSSSSVKHRGPRVQAAAVTVSHVANETELLELYLPFDVAPDVNGTLHLNGTGSCAGDTVGAKTAASCCSLSANTASWVVSLGVVPNGTEQQAAPPPSSFVPASSITIETQQNALRARFNVTHLATATATTTVVAVEVRFQYEDNPTCAVYGGALSGPDSIYAQQPRHYGLPAEMWRGTVNVRMHALGIEP